MQNKVTKKKHRMLINCLEKSVEMYNQEKNLNIRKFQKQKENVAQKFLEKF